MEKGKKVETLMPVEEQPYKVPDNWRWASLQQVCVKQITDGTHKTPTYSDRENGIPFVSAKDVTKGFIDWDNVKYITKELHQELHNRLSPKVGDVLLAKNGTTGVAAIVDIDTVFDLYVTLALLRPNTKLIHPQYLHYLINSPMCKMQFDAHLTGIGVPNLHLRDIKVINIPLPPCKEQLRIVLLIQRLCSKLDEAKENVQGVLKSFEEGKISFLHKAFSGILTEKWRNQNGITLDSWKELTLDDVASYKKGPFGSSITKAMFVPKGEHTYKVYEQGNAIRKTLEYGRYYISEQKYRELEGFAVCPNDIIISCAGTIGEVYVLPDQCEPGVINQALMRVRLFDNIDQRFFVYYFGEAIKSDVIDQSNGTAIKNIPPFKTLKAMPIKLPTLNEQIIIADQIDKYLDKEQRSKKLAEEIITNIDMMKKTILSKAFRGELGTNKPSEPPVELA